MRATRGGRCSRRGQVLVIFAVFSVALFGVMGLAVDAGRAYTVAARELQAAKAGALAGVPYMPGDTVSATNAAQVEAARNGYATGDTTNGRQVVVTATVPAGTTNQLKVTVSDKIGVSLMAIFGFGSFTVSRSATAYYLPPINLGQPGTSIGADLPSLGSSSFYMLTEGQSVARSQGDPFTPTSNGDWAYAGGGYANSCDVSGSAPCKAVPADRHILSGVNGTDVNNATFVAPTIPVGLTSLPPNGGFNYQLFVPAGQSADLQVYNPAYDPDPNPGNFTADYLDFYSFPQNSDSTDLAAMTYTVFKETNLFSHLGDVPVTSQTFLPFDATGGSGSTCANNRFCTYDGAGTKTTNVLPLPWDYHQWVDVIHAPVALGSASLVRNSHILAPTSHLTGGASGTYYRLRVDTMDWWGRVPGSADNAGPYSYHGYAVQATGCATCSLGAMNDMTLFTPVNNTGSSGSFSIPLFNVPKEYKGQTLSVYLFAMGDVSGGADVHIKFPAYNKVGGGTVATADASATGLNDLGPGLGAGTSTGLNAVGYGTPPTVAAPEPAYLTTATSGGAIYRGCWLQFLITVPTNYDGPVASAYWSLVYDVNGTAHDAFSVQVSLTGGSPVHLLP